MYCNINKNYSISNTIKSQKTVGEQTCSQSFGGFTRLVKGSHKREIPFLSTQDFLKISAPFKSKVAGKLPSEFLSLFPEEPKKLFDFLGQLAQFSRPCRPFFEDFEYFKIKTSSGISLPIKPLGSGTYGTCLKMNFEGKKPYVFKSFFHNYSDLCDTSLLKHGAVAEMRTGLNLSAKKYSDIAQWHIGSIEDHKSWQIMEFLDWQNADCFKRDGDLLRFDKPDLILGDGPSENCPTRNNIRGVRYDFGGIYKDEPSNILDPRIKNFLDGRSKLKAYRALLSDPNLQGKRKISYLIEYLPPEHRKACFYETLNHSDPEVRNNVRVAIRHLHKSDRKEAFYAVLNSSYPEVRRGSGEQVQYLIKDDKLDAFEAVYTHPEPGVKDGLWADVRWLLQDENKQHWDDIFKTMFPTFKIEI